MRTRSLPGSYIDRSDARAREPFAGDDDLEVAVLDELAGDAVGVLDVAEPHRSAERVAVRARADVADHVPAEQDRLLSVEQRLGIGQQELHQATRVRALLVLGEERVAADEAAGLVEVDRELQAGLQR